MHAPHSFLDARIDAHVANAELVRRARAGDRVAFARLWQRYAPTAHAVILSVLTAGSAEDLLQDVAVNALAALPTLRNDDGFPAWLCAIARNRARNVRNAMRRAPAAEDVDGLTAAVPSIDEAEADEILATIRSLPETYREPLLLRLVAGLSGPEIADRLDMTPGSVRVNLCRGIKLLRARLSGGYER